MPTVVNTNLAGFTVDYNTVQFGGADAPYTSLPPQYKFSMDPEWDSSRRSIKWLNCQLHVQCIFLASDRLEATMATMMDNVISKLTKPAQQLKLSGLGSGFGNIPTLIVGPGVYDLVDLKNGPLPLYCRLTPIGQIAYEVQWGVSFSFLPCVGAGASTDSLSFTHFNFTTAWRNDFEGYSVRMIQGSAGIAGLRAVASPKTIVHIADETRGNILVSVPINFRRVENSWTESEDKMGVNFSVIDEQLKGDPFPAGIVDADGAFSFTSGSTKNAMNMSQALGTLTMRLKTAYNQPKNLAGQIFIAAALNKAADIKTAIGNTTGCIVPMGFHLSTGKYGSARMTQGTISWMLTKDFNSLLSAAGIFDPIRLTGSPGNTTLTGNYTDWAASMALMWNNRGVSGYANLASECNVVDLCDNLHTPKTIGNVSSSPNNPANANFASLACPTVPNNGGWISFDLQIQAYREDDQTFHKKASSYIPAISQIGGYDYNNQPNSSGLGQRVRLGGPAYSQGGSDEAIAEYHGYPINYIGLSFVGARYKYPAFVPEIQSVGGVSARLWKQAPCTPYHGGDSFGCPISIVKGWRIYRIPGAIPNNNAINGVTSLTAADIAVPLDL